jgi:hypothetical protein
MKGIKMSKGLTFALEENKIKVVRISKNKAAPLCGSNAIKTAVKKQLQR